MESSSGAGAEIERSAAARDREKLQLLGERETYRRNSSNIFCDLLLRVIALLLSLGALVVIASDEDTETVFLTLAPGLPGFTTRITVYFHDFPSLIFFVVANGIGVLYSIFSLVMSLINRGRMKGLTLLTLILDATVVAILFTSLGATFDVGIIAYNGLPRAQWEKVCYVFQDFCNQAAAALAVSGAASLIFFLLTIVGATDLYRKII